MEKVFALIGVVVAVVVLVLALPLAGTAGGALAGWIVGWFYGQEITLFFEGLGVKGLTPSQIGAVLGFVGGFFKATQTSLVGIDN